MPTYQVSALRMKAIMESLPGGVEKPKIYTGLLVGNRDTNHSPQHIISSHGPAASAWPCADCEL